MSVRLQPLTRARVASLGERGAKWAAALPDILGSLTREWEIDPGSSLPGGSNSYVVHATTAAGEPAVLKIVLDDAGLADQIRVLETANGRGYARLLRADPARRATLLEALGDPLRDFCATVQRAGRPLAESYARLLADRTGVDAERIWRWAFLERVSTGLYVLGLGSEPVARPFLDSAALLLDRG